MQEIVRAEFVEYSQETAAVVARDWVDLHSFALYRLNWSARDGRVSVVRRNSSTRAIVARRPIRARYADGREVPLQYYEVRFRKKKFEPPPSGGGTLVHQNRQPAPPEPRDPTPRGSSAA